MGERPWIRRAGAGTLADGRHLLWSVAEGRRGRRWRASTRDAGGVLLDDLLLEADADGRVARLELTTASGLLTFHPEPDERSAHGNIVGPDGVRHLALAWAPGLRIEIPWSPVADAVLVSMLAGGGRVAVATIGPDLVPRPQQIDVERVGETGWLVDGRPVAVDADGLPVAGTDSASWPLEDPSIRPS